MKKPLYLLFLLFVVIKVHSQALYKVSNEEKIINSTLVIEGKVVQSTPFWNANKTFIYTANKIEITKIFKGTLSKNYIEIITQGGTIDSLNIDATDLLSLQVGDVGIFCCYKNSLNITSPTTGNILYDVYASGQGFFKYDLYNGTAADAFTSYESIENQLYPTIQQLTNQPVQIVGKLTVTPSKKKLENARTNAVSINSISPTTINAGALLDPTNNVLTITGSGFGTFTGTAAVIFNDGNFAPGTNYVVAANDTHLSTLVDVWTDNLIKVKVPTRASTGVIRVRNSSGSEAPSFDVLNVFFSVLNANLTVSGVPVVKESNLMNVDLNGGYTIYYSNNTAGNGVDFDQSPAKQTFQRALNTWKDIVGFNVTEGGTTSNQALSGSAPCTVMFDNTNTGVSPLPAGVLAVCYSYNVICSGSPLLVQARKPKFDIVVRNNAVSSGSTQFNLGPCSPQATNTSLIDLETVIFHELGHALNLGHINDGSQGFGNGTTNPGKLMNYAIIQGVKRSSPDASAKYGGLYCVFPEANNYGTCNTNTEMVPLTTIQESKDDCPLNFTNIPTAPNTVVSFNMVHTSSDLRVDPAYTQIRCDNVGTPVTNNAYYVIRTSSTGILSMTILNYNTVPAELATCPFLTPSIRTSGFRVAVYQVNACPTAGNYPNPIACRLFTGNGVLSDITGLQANTNYLVYFEAVENTKATFDVVFGGSALPIKLNSFAAEALSDYNLLKWKAEYSINVATIIIEKSLDAVNFFEIGKINYPETANLEGSYKDLKPNLINYYRLKMIDKDGTVAYSNVVSVKRNDKLLININPNPATDWLNIAISSDKSERLNIKLFAANGQLVLNSNVNQLSGNTTHKLALNQLAKGIYYVTINGENGNIIYSKTVMVQ